MLEAAGRKCPSEWLLPLGLKTGPSCWSRLNLLLSGQRVKGVPKVTGGLATTQVAAQACRLSPVISRIRPDPSVLPMQPEQNCTPCLQWTDTGLELAALSGWQVSLIPHILGTVIYFLLEA